MESLSTSSLKRDSAPAEHLKTLPRSFYERETLAVAPDLLGKILVVGSCSGRIVETEAYRGDDPASHSFRGETQRTSVMFGAPGFAYVYFIYGNYEMLNFVTERQGTPGAVLIRAIEPLSGFPLMRRRRQGRPREEWSNGPGRLCRAFGIRMSYNRKPLQGPEIIVADDRYQPERISVSPRVGISMAQDKLWRFFIAANPYVSRVPQNKLAKELR